jgi:hypothetical protein
MITHCAFDNIAIEHTEISAVSRLTVMMTIATIVIDLIHELIMRGSIAPFGRITPGSNTIALEEVAHSSFTIHQMSSSSLMIACMPWSSRLMS